ncbi:putative aldouronate transport system substrate-binding protein [Glycomyces sambucus]|uniref:Putative aldouronate transport system substrate-binding protein n=1 Tax=Glycomyces sambucus TaxID=380244 RepID=A0A1G9MQK6_9ACTN|nr:extracellular solute-binding protein [Glycomyces sambucus]SDL76499.1 putative aldouronate transport system substrate-binding protein [Glycomyces sambucus]
MATPSDRSPLRRRSLFKVAGLGAAGAAGLPVVAACSDIESGAGSSQATEGFDFLPTYKEFPLPVEPDLVGEPPNHPSGFTSYPEPVDGVETAEAGGEYEITVPMWGTPPSGDDPYFAALQEAWGGTKVNLRHADGNTFAQTSVQWLQANEFGDAINMFGWMTDSHPNFQETVVNTFYDLTDIVKGDISDRWPLLAGEPTLSWGQSVWSTDTADPESARVFGVPQSFYGGPGNGMFVRTDLLEAAGLAMPTTVEEVLEVARAWSDGANGKWAFLGLDYVTPEWFGLASSPGWAYIDGKLVHNCERPEYTEWLTFRRTCWDEGLIHPDTPTGTLDGHALHVAGTILMSQDGISWWSDYTNQVLGGTAEGQVDPIGAIGASGREPIRYVSKSVGGWTFFNKDLSEDQVKELLDVMNFCSAPYGTKEYELLQYGVEGTHFDYGDDGFPVRTEAGIATVQAPVNFKEMSGQVQTFLSGDPDLVQRRFEYNASVKDFAEENIFKGLRVEGPAEYKTASQTLLDQQDDIAYGRAELSSIPDMVETFLNSGGEAAREHFQSSYDQAQGK